MAHVWRGRIVLDRLLAPVLKAVGGSVRTERFFASATEGGDGLAASRLDYAVYRNPATAGDAPQLIAIVEAKRSGGDLNQVRPALFSNGAPQCMLSHSGLCGRCTVQSAFEQMSFVPNADTMPRLLRRLISNATLLVRGWLVQALVQVTAQLLTVYPTLTKYCRAGTGPYKPLVGIVTDAERFAVVILDHETLYLMNCCSHKIRSYDGVSDVAKSIQSVATLSANPPAFSVLYPTVVVLSTTFACRTRFVQVHH